jgi:hypothetical protein
MPRHRPTPRETCGELDEARWTHSADILRATVAWMRSLSPSGMRSTQSVFANVDCRTLSEDQFGAAARLATLIPTWTIVAPARWCPTQPQTPVRRRVMMVPSEQMATFGVTRQSFSGPGLIFAPIHLCDGMSGRFRPHDRLSICTSSRRQTRNLWLLLLQPDLIRRSESGRSTAAVPYGIAFLRRSRISPLAG